MSVLVAAPTEPFRGSIDAIDDATFARMRGVSWRDDPRCPPRDALRRVSVSHATLTGEPAHGELIVARAIAPRVVTLFARLHAIGFPIARMQLVDDFGGDDAASMAADNASAFNFRCIAGTDILSQHAFGLAIDVNPRENPMVWPGQRRFVPAEAAAHLDRRTLRPGMIVRPGPVTAIFDDLGWEWGGDWVHVADLHHLVWSRAL